MLWSVEHDDTRTENGVISDIGVEDVQEPKKTCIGIYVRILLT